MYKTLHAEHLKHIGDGEVRDAYRFIVGFAACLPEFECRPEKSTKRDFRFLKAGEQPFAVLLNKQLGLLFYFRKPAQGHPACRPDRLRELGFEVNDKTETDGEVTVRVGTVEEARRLMTFVFGEPV